SGAGALGRGLENLDEGLADDFAFAFGIGDALETAEEQSGGVLVLELEAEVAAKDLPDDLRLAPAQQTIVDKNAGELVADGFVEQGGGHAGIHAAAQSEDDTIA